MKVRMKVGVLGSFWGIEGKPPFGYSVEPGDIFDLPDREAIRLIASGQAETKLDGPLGRPGQLSMPEKDFQALKAKVEGRPEKPAAPPAPERPRTREEREQRMAAINW